MNPIRTLLILVAALAANACTTLPGPEPAPAFYVMRHLHTPEGERNPDLTEQGRRHAERIAEAVARHPPRAIFVSQWKRTGQTAAPLAARLGLTPIVYDAGDTDALLARLRSTPGPVLVVGHSNTVPDIVERLGGARPADLSHHDFGDIWVIFPGGRTEPRRLSSG